jgi:hypothetical protein
LYNDANETNGDFGATFSPTADGTFTPNGKDGFTLAVVSSTVYAGIKLNEDVISGDSVYVSFNCSFDAGSPSPKIALRDTDSDFFGGGTIMSNEESVVNGFNSFTLTSTNSLASGVALSEADDNLTYSISDFKVSRIARNGFVETLYDQSGNGNDATQASAASQPSIVLNGGIYKDSNGIPSVNFTATSTTTNEGRYLNFTKVNFGGTMSFFSKLFIRRPASGGNGRHFSEDGNAGADKSIIIMDTSQYNFFSGGSNIISGTGIQESDNVHTFLLNNQNKLNIFINGGANSNNEITLANTIADFEIGRMGAIQEKGNSFEVDMDLSEAVFYSTDKASDRTDIEREMANFYNITLS